ncbi:MAG TPA: Na+/H+ antiporter NhaA [Gammaproteobacteria bacterium]|nr:Na+/H+ antiporter NhaA [Gammaproteobacteria bacterium]
MNQDNTGLPQEIADRFAEPFARFLKIEAAAGALLLLATVAALILSNSAWSAPFLAFWETPVGVHFGALDFSRSLRHWINDGLMTLFFFVVALELKRELVLGELRNRRMAALPFAGALGGMLVPTALYLALLSGQPGMHGWGTVMATDTAFVIGCLALFGSRIPPSLRLFLLSLAIFDDVGAIVVVAVGYGDALNWLALGLGLIGLAIVAGAALIGIRSIPIFFLFGGMIWLCFDASGIHPTIAGVILGLMTPTHGWVSDERLRGIFGRVLSYPTGDRWSGDTMERRDLRRAGAAATETLSPVERLEMMLHPWVGFAIMPIFAIANAGVALSVADVGHAVSVAILAGLVFGKPIGVLSFSWLAVRSGLATRPLRLSWALLAAGSLLTGIGFTMSLFIAGLAYAPAMLSTAKIGILTASAISAASGLLMLTWLTVRKRIT